MFNIFKKGRYSKRKQNKERGDIISYEDMPLEDYEQEKTDISPVAVKKILLGVCIALAAGLIVFAFANRDKLTPDNIAMWWTYEVLGNAGGGYPVDLIGSEVKSGNFAVNQGRPAYASDTSFVTLNTTGREVANVQLRYSKPIMKASENRFLTYGLGDKNYQIQNFEKNLYSGEAENKIYTGDIASNGIYCLVTESSGYLTELFAFDSNNNRIFKYSFSEYYIISVALNPDGSGCIACGITSDNGAVKTGVYVLDFEQSEPISKYEISNDTVLDCKYLSPKRAVLIGETASYIVKIGEDDYTTISYEDKPIANYSFNKDTKSFALALSKSGDGRSCTLISYNDNGDVISTIDTDSGAESMSMYKGVIAVLDGNMIYAFDSGGRQIHSSFAGTGAKALILNSDSEAYVMSVNQLRRIDLNKTSTADSVE